MVEQHNKGLPPAPRAYPDPTEYISFALWLKELTADRGKRYGVTQTMIAEVTGKTPQAVTKWTKGGRIEPERIGKLSQWMAIPYQQLSRLVDMQLSPYLKVVFDIRDDTPGTSHAVPLAVLELNKLISQLDAEGLKNLRDIAKTLLKSQKPRKK